MIRHALILICRNFIRFKSVFFINLVGLSSGLACAILIFLWINDELSFDKFHTKRDRLFQIHENTKTSNGIVTRNEMPLGLAKILVKEMPEIEYAATVTPPRWFPKFVVSSANGTPVKAEGKFAGKDFFQIFSYPLASGNVKQVLTDKYSIAISQELARKLFGESHHALGKTIDWKISDMKYQSVVSGVFENVPANSSDQFDMVMPDTRLAEIMGFTDADDLTSFGPSTFLTLKPGSDINLFNTKLTSFWRSKRNDAADKSWFISLYGDTYLYGKFEDGKPAASRINSIKLFAFIGLFILIIACINFMNLSTAKASHRLKEVGIKKTIGAGRRVLVIQYLGESILMCILAMVVAILIVDLLLPEFNTITGKKLTLNFTRSLVLWLTLIVLSTGVLAGSYPALYLSGFNPVTVLKGKLNTSFGEVWVRKALVVFQFVISIIFIAAVAAIVNQLDYILTKNLGYHRDNVIYFECHGTIADDPGAFTSQVESLPGVASASSMISGVATAPGYIPEAQVDGKKISLHTWRVNYGLIETLGIQMLEGRTFSPHDKGTAKVIFNEEAIKALGIQDPVGKTIDFFNGQQAEIIGVTKNFHFQALYERISPLAIQLENGRQWNVLVRITKGEETKAIAAIEAFYKNYNPGFPFDFKFLDQDYKALYASEQRVYMLTRTFAGLAIIISCLGLFGLAAFTVERRMKEISLRKVLGASEETILYLLSKDFTQLVFASILIGLPLSYWITDSWLNTFAYRIKLNPSYFLFAGGIALILSWLTVGSQTIRAAKTNPVKNLRND